MTRYLIIWDWDNTLANTKQAVFCGLQDVANHYGLNSITEADVVNVMGSHRGDFWQHNFKEKVPEAVEYYVSCYRKHSAMVHLFVDTRTVLDFVQSKRIPQIVLSNKNEKSLAEEVRAKEVEDYFEVIQGTNSPVGKPQIAFVQPILDQFKPDHVILIGDGASDMMMAQNMGATAIMVHQFNPDLPYQYYCDTLSEVRICLESLLK